MLCLTALAEGRVCSIDMHFELFVLAVCPQVMKNGGVLMRANRGRWLHCFSSQKSCGRPSDLSYLL